MQVKTIKPLRQKLDELTELPDGFSFDAAVSWNQLEGRISRNSSRKKKWAWYIAAASVLILFSVVYLFRTDEPDELAIKTPSAIIRKPVSLQLINRKNASVAVAKEKITIPSTGITSNEKKQNVFTVKKPVTVQEQVTEQAPVNDTINPATATIESISIPAHPTTVVKRKIVHINELGKEMFFKEQQILSVKEENAVNEILQEETQPTSKPWYKKIKLSNRNNNN
ncbi:MAG: hypothetical protein U0T11_06265 [Chitinophagaceae bacterium]